MTGQMPGPEAVVESPRVMGGEDFSYVLQQAPGAFVTLGVAMRTWAGNCCLYHTRLDVDEEALPIEVALRVAFARAVLRELATDKGR